MKSQNNTINNETDEKSTNGKLKSLSELAQTLLAEVELLQNVEYESELRSLTGEKLSVALKTNIDFYNEIQRLEVYLIKSALKQTKGCQKCAAQLLNLNVTTLNTKIKHLGIPVFSSRINRPLKHQHSIEEGHS
jgi:transcriptional regulator with GAF, ATPase, and Fis domain